MSVKEWTGSILILTSVFVISLGGNLRTEQQIAESEHVSSTDLVLAIGFALMTGLMFSLNSLNVKYFLQEYSFPPDQLTYDANLVFGVLLLPFWIAEQSKNPEFTFAMNFKGFLIAWMFSLAHFSATLAFDLGKAGNVQAIENLKIVVQTLMVSVIDGLIPNSLEISGIFLSILGVLLIVLKK